MYDLVQQEFIKRNELRSASKTGRGKQSSIRTYLQNWLT